VTPTLADVDTAYRDCERITRRAAANFFYGIRLLPREKRRAMSAVYAFARCIDDIGDGDLDPAGKLEALAAERRRLALLSGPGLNGHRDPVLVALAHAQARFELPLEALEHLIDGVEQDVSGTTYETFDELVAYCRCVAGSIGRLCLAIFGDSGSVEAPELADDLGVAMQLTNILRDVREDEANGRVYLPAEDRRAFGCEDLDTAAPEALAELVGFEAGRAREWFDRGLGLVDGLDARSASCVLAMTGIYRSILDRIAREPTAVMRRRISLPPWEKAWVAARSLAGVGA
jgi:15-cis-phytoene synthase